GAGLAARANNLRSICRRRQHGSGGAEHGPPLHRNGHRSEMHRPDRRTIGGMRGIAGGGGMTGRVSLFQPLYAEAGVTTIPVSTDAKKPLVTNYLKMGIPASAQLAQKFTTANALGIVCGTHNKITVLDVDSTDRGILREAIARHGEPRAIAKTASSKF